MLYLHWLNWLIDLGNPEDDLLVATILLLVGGQLVLLRPRKVSPALTCDRSLTIVPGRHPGAQV